MKENQNHIDNLFRDSLKTYRTEPPADVKGNIHKGLDASHVKGFFTGKNLFLSGIILAVCVTGLTLYTVYFSSATSGSELYAQEVIYRTHKNIQRNIDPSNGGTSQDILPMNNSEKNTAIDNTPVLYNSYRNHISTIAADKTNNIDAKDPAENIVDAGTTKTEREFIEHAVVNQMEKIKTDLGELNNKINALLLVSSNNNDLAKAKSKEADNAYQGAALNEDADKKQKETEAADKLKSESDDYEKLSIAANNLYRQLGTIYKEKEKDLVDAQKLSADIKDLLQANNETVAKKKLFELQNLAVTRSTIEALNKEANEVFVFFVKDKNSSSERFSALAKRYNTTADSLYEQASRIKKEADETGNKTKKQELMNQYQDLKLQAEKFRQHADQNQSISEELQRESSSFKTQIDLSNSVLSELNNIQEKNGNTNDADKTSTNTTTAEKDQNTNPNHDKLSSSKTSDQPENKDITLPEKSDVKDAKSKNNRFSLDVFTSPAMNFKSLTASGVGDNYVSFRKAGESPLTTLGFGAELKYDFRNLFLQSGIDYCKYGEKINYDENLLASVDTTESHWSYDTIITEVDTMYQDSMGTWIYDTLYYTSYETSWHHITDSLFNKLSAKEYNQLTYVEIPILVGYSFTKGKLTYRIATGISYAFLSGTKGKLLRTSADGFNDMVVAVPFRKNMYNFIFRFGCYYLINNRMSLFLQPSFRMNLNSVFDKDYPVSQKYKSIGINAGINYKF